MRGVGALIGEALHLARSERPVAAQPRDDVEADGVAHAVGDKRLLARAVDAHAAPADLRGAPRAKRLIQRILLVAKATADIGLDDADVAPRAAERLSHDAADDVRDLRGGDDRDAAVFLIGEAPVVFDVAVLHGGGVVPALHPDQARLLRSGLIVAFFHVRVLEDVVREVFVQLRRTRLHRLLRVEHERQFLVFDPQRAHALHGRDLVFRDDDGHIVSVIAHMPVEQMPVGHVLMARIHRPRMTRRWERMLRHVEAGQHLHHAVDLFGGGLVHGFDQPVRDLRVLDADIERLAGHQILIVFRSPGRLVKGVHAHLAFSDLCHMYLPPCPEGRLVKIHDNSSYKLDLL